MYTAWKDVQKQAASDLDRTRRVNIGLSANRDVVEASYTRELAFDISHVFISAPEAVQPTVEINRLKAQVRMSAWRIFIV